MSENVAPKSKGQLRAERRAVQEAQRAAKATGKPVQQPRPQQQPRISESSTSQPQQPSKGARKKTPSTSEQGRSSSRDKSVSQGPDPGLAVDSSQGLAVRRGSRDEGEKPVKAGQEVHPAFAKLALRLAAQTVTGSDAQCLAVIEAFKQLAIDYHPPGDKAYSREFENVIKPCISRISGNRSLPPATASLVKQLKLHLSTISNETPEGQARSLVLEWLDDFADRNIVLSTRAIAEAVTDKLKTMAHGGNKPMVVMIYNFSAVVEKTLVEACGRGVRLEVVVVDSWPRKEGLLSVRRLGSLGVRCRYVLVTGMGGCIGGVDLVLLGAEGLLANGNVVASLGSTQVAMTASARNVPVLVLCHTYKFCEKVFTLTLETDWPDTELVPPEFVTGVVTELRTLPCTAVPAVLRVKQLGGAIS